MILSCGDYECSTMGVVDGWGNCGCDNYECHTVGVEEGVVTMSVELWVFTWGCDRSGDNRECDGWMWKRGCGDYECD